MQNAKLKMQNAKRKDPAIQGLSFLHFAFCIFNYFDSALSPLLATTDASVYPFGNSLDV